MTISWTNCFSLVNLAVVTLLKWTVSGACFQRQFLVLKTGASHHSGARNYDTLCQEKILAEKKQSLLPTCQLRFSSRFITAGF